MRPLSLLALTILLLPGTATPADIPVPFTEEQASRGERIYLQRCAHCHGRQLWDGAASPLVGSDFRRVWGAEERSLFDLYQVTQTTMPVTAEGTLSPDTMADLLAFILKRNGYSAGDEPLPADPDALKGIRLPVSP